MGVYVIGVVGVIVFYLAVLGVGIWAATVKTKKARPGQDAMMLANRGLGPLLGIFTLIDTPETANKEWQRGGERRNGERQPNELIMPRARSAEDWLNFTCRGSHGYPRRGYE